MDCSHNMLRRGPYLSLNRAPLPLCWNGKKCLCSLYITLFYDILLAKMKVPSISLYAASAEEETEGAIRSPPESEIRLVHPFSRLMKSWSFVCIGNEKYWMTKKKTLCRVNWQS